MHHPARRRRAPLVVLVCVVLAASACSREPAQTETVAPPVTEPAGGAAQEPEGTATDAVADRTEPVAEATDAPSQEAAPAEPLAVVEGSPPYAALEIADLRRVGDAVTLEFVVETAPSDGGSFSVDDQFAAPVDRFIGDEAQAGIVDARRRAVSGATLVDQDNAKRHLVLRDSEGLCLCTDFPDRVEPGTRYRHSAQFPAPPEGVETVTVQVPMFPAVDGVPLRRLTP